jgi:hypothetical protein
MPTFPRDLVRSLRHRLPLSGIPTITKDCISPLGVGAHTRELKTPEPSGLGPRCRIAVHQTLKARTAGYLRFPCARGNATLSLLRFAARCAAIIASLWPPWAHRVSRRIASREAAGLTARGTVERRLTLVAALKQRRYTFCFRRTPNRYATCAAHPCQQSHRVR